RDGMADFDFPECSRAGEVCPGSEQIAAHLDVLKIRRPQKGGVGEDDVAIHGGVAQGETLEENAAGEGKVLFEMGIGEIDAIGKDAVAQEGAMGDFDI